MDFGFGLNPSSAIELDKQDLRLYEKLCRIEPTAATCIACGSCSATCTAAVYSGMSVRKLLIGLQRRRSSVVKQMLSHCMLCDKCTMVSPHGINRRRVILTVCRLYDNVEGVL
jgi:heterodisulfide reductase subunit C